ncbi:rhomboid-related protein 4-like [Ylistrum balloti]|uniref:rhomboid-related protein 4-like n=1 Tax=Ylistrum balloti TaxID=509963 RepID=UPI002905CE00|nr:rhomboid-related protein 4-like [Ylistrum balloti]
MFSGRRRGGRGNFGVLLLGAQVMRMGVHNIPPVTLATVALQVAIYLQLGDLPKWFGHPQSVCMSVYKVWYKGYWKLLILAALTHGDDIHLYYNMASMLWKGRQLERKFKSVYFAFLLAIFTILSGIAYVALNMAFTFITDDQSYELTCAVGFSGVLFALKVLVSHYSPRGTQYIMGFIPVPSRQVFWAELVLIQIITPHASFTGHLAGILVGLLYIKGPLKPLMDSFVPTVPSYTYTSQTSGYNTRYNYGAGPGQRSGYRDPNQQARAPPRGYGWNSNGNAQGEGDYSDYTGGLSEEEQTRRATEESLRQNRGGNQDRLYPDLEDLRQRRQNRYQ